MFDDLVRRVDVFGEGGVQAAVRADADSGSLPSFCIIDPDFRSYSEETPARHPQGESFAAEVISRVMHGPAGRTRCSSRLIEEKWNRPALTRRDAPRPRRSAH
jgi:hypothetical protein